MRATTAGLAESSVLLAEEMREEHAAGTGHEELKKVADWETFTPTARGEELGTAPCGRELATGSSREELEIVVGWETLDPTTGGEELGARSSRWSGSGPGVWTVGSESGPHSRAPGTEADAEGEASGVEADAEGEAGWEMFNPTAGGEELEAAPGGRERTVSSGCEELEMVAVWETLVPTAGGEELGTATGGRQHEAATGWLGHGFPTVVSAGRGHQLR